MSEAGASDGARPRESPALLAVIWAVAVAAVLLPIALVRIPPLADYPNHLARAFILAFHQRSPDIERFYAAIPGLQPNWAFDAIAAVLAAPMGIFDAGRVAIALTLLALLAGTAFLHAALHGRVSPWPVLAALFVYNRLLAWGFAGYLLTLGLAMSALALAVVTRRAGWPARLLLGLVAGCVVFIGHLFAFGVYAVALVMIEAHEQWRSWHAIRRFDRVSVAVTLVPLAIIAIVFLALSPNGGERTLAWSDAGLSSNLSAFAYPFIGYSPALDAVFVAAVAALVLYGLVRRRLRLAGAMVPVLAALLALQMLMPDALFGSFMADRRIPVAMVFLVIAASSWRRGESARVRAVAGALVAALLVARVVVIADAWTRADRAYGEVLSAIEEMPRGARVLDIAIDTLDRKAWRPSFAEAASLAVITRDAYVPSLYASPLFSGQTVAFRQPYARLAAALPPLHVRQIAAVPGPAAAQALLSETPRMSRGVVACFDHVLVSKPPGFEPRLPAFLQPVAESDHVTLFVVRGLDRGECALLASGGGVEQ